MSKTLTIKRTTPSSNQEAKSATRAPVRGRNRNNHVAPSKPSVTRADFGVRPARDDRAPRPPRASREGDRRDSRDERPRASRSDFGARPPRDDRAPRPPREHRESNRAPQIQRDSVNKRDDRSRTPRSDFGARPVRDDKAPRPPRENLEGVDKRDGRDSRDARGGKPSHRESLSRAPQRHGKVRDGVREVVDGHVVRGDKRPALRKPQFPKGRDHSSELKSNPAEGIRVSKYLADKGMCSRREADQYIEKGWVTVNGKRTSLGQRILPTDKVQLARQASVAQESRVTILINKPMGYVSGQAEDGYAPAVSLVTAENQWDEAEFQQDFNFKHLRGLAPAGRLDIDSVGLLVLTQDGRVAKALIGEDSDVDKEYLVRVEGELIENGLALLNHGLELDGVPLRPAQVSWQNDEQLMFVLREGKKRQIRRMCELVGLKVVGLKRVRIGNIRLGHLPTGKWRYLSPDEQF